MSPRHLMRVLEWRWEREALDTWVQGQKFPDQTPHSPPIPHPMGDITVVKGGVKHDKSQVNFSLALPPPPNQEL